MPKAWSMQIHSLVICNLSKQTRRPVCPFHIQGAKCWFFSHCFCPLTLWNTIPPLQWGAENTASSLPPPAWIKIKIYFLRPLSVEWLDSRPHFDDVRGFHCHGFQAYHSVGQLVVLKQVLVFSHNKIQDLLVREDGFFEILNPGFSEVFWEIS